MDTAKAGLIFLVVLGHFHYFYAAVPGRTLIYAFHVPGFVFLTGFLLPPEFGRIGLAGLWRKWLGVYLRAYGTGPLDGGADPAETAAGLRTQVIV